MIRRPRQFSFVFTAVASGLLGVVLIAAAAAAPAASIPELAGRYQRDLVNIAQAEYGLTAPVARLAALIHVESAWNPRAESPYAQGLAQFTPATAAWIAQIVPELSPADPWDPNWGLRAAAYYTHWIHKRIKPRRGTLSACSHWAMTLSAYNGGLGWVYRDRDLTEAHGGNPDCWRDVARHSDRARWAFEENRAYPRKILLRWEHVYIEYGWPGQWACWRT